MLWWFVTRTPTPMLWWFVTRKPTPMLWWFVTRKPTPMLWSLLGDIGQSSPIVDTQDQVSLSAAGAGMVTGFCTGPGLLVGPGLTSGRPVGLPRLLRLGCWR
jgi:hypothetical protein